MDAYPNTDPPFVLQINFEEVAQMDEREWNRADDDSLDSTLSPLYSCIEKRTGPKTQEIIDEVDRLNLSHVSSLVCIVSSHGDSDDDGLDFFYTADGEMMVEDFVSLFTVAKCPALEGKPKIFIFEMCRGEKSQVGVWLGSESKISRTRSPVTDRPLFSSQCPEKDFLLAFATLPGYEATTHKSLGSVYLQALARSIDEAPSGADICEVLVRTNRRLVRGTPWPAGSEEKAAGFTYTQTAVFHSSLTRRCLLGQLFPTATPWRQSDDEVNIDRRPRHRSFGSSGREVDFPQSISVTVPF